MRKILRSMSNCVAALRSAMYVSTVRLARPMAFPISAELRLVFYCTRVLRFLLFRLLSVVSGRWLFRGIEQRVSPIKVCYDCFYFCDPADL